MCSLLLAISPYHQDVPANVCCSILLFSIIFKLLLFRFITCFYVSVAVPILLQGSSFTAASCSSTICGKQTIYIVNAYPVCKLVHPAHFHAHNVYLHTRTHISIVHFAVYSCEVILYGNVICNTAVLYVLFVIYQATHVQCSCACVHVRIWIYYNTTHNHHHLSALLHSCCLESTLALYRN